VGYVSDVMCVCDRGGRDVEAWYLLGALSVDHGGWRWGSEQGQLRAEKLSGLQRWGMVGHAASLIHTAEQVVLEHTGTQVSTNTACSISY